MWTFLFVSWDQRGGGQQAEQYGWWVWRWVRTWELPLCFIFQYSAVSFWSSPAQDSHQVTTDEIFDRNYFLTGIQRDIKFPPTDLTDFNTLICKKTEMSDHIQKFLPMLKENTKYKKSKSDDQYLAHHKLLREGEESDFFLYINELFF